MTRLGWNERTGEPFYEAKLRALAIQSAIYFSDADVVHQALQRYQTGDIPKFAKAAVYFAVIKFGPENEYDKFYQKFLNTGNEQERIVLIESLALARQPTNLQKTLDLLLSVLYSFVLILISMVRHLLVRLKDLLHYYLQLEIISTIQIIFGILSSKIGHKLLTSNI